MLGKQANQVGATLKQENPTGLRFQLRDFFHDIACDDVGIVPGDFLQAGRDHVLGNAVKDVSHISCSVGPGSCHFLVGFASGEHRVGLAKGAHHMLPNFLIHVGKYPLIGRFHDAIQGHDLRYS